METEKLLDLLSKGNHSLVWCKRINYYGYENGTKSVPHLIYRSVNDYFAGKIPEVTENIIKPGSLNLPAFPSQKKMKSIEFITIHDTGAARAGSTAWANSHWCTNPANNRTSWHYTIGNDGIFHQAEDDSVCWHAGDGTDWATTTVFTDTKIKKGAGKPAVGIKNGFLCFNDKPTDIIVPETGINRLGLIIVEKDGTYQLPSLWITGGYNHVLACRGGNINSIGIETAVNSGSDVYKTWQYTAKFTARLLVKYNLLPDRVVFHNNWSNKLCPQTMITAGMVEEFLNLVYMEYEILKNYADYKISFQSHNPDIIDNEGRVIGSGTEKDTEVSYKIIVEKDGITKTRDCFCTVSGRKNL